MFDLNSLVQEATLSPEQARDASHRFRVLKAMDILVHATNDEGLVFNHWLYIIPDGADDEELLDIAVNDEDIFNSAVRCFLESWSKYAHNGGLFVGSTVYPLADSSGDNSAD